MGCKRVLISDDYYPALEQPNVELVTDAIAEVTPSGVVTADGSEHEVDAIIFGTGFHVTDLPIAQLVRGRDGRPLAEAWQGSPQAYLGTTVAGFPNLFLLLGPNTGLGHNSVVFMIEAQINYVLECARAHAARRRWRRSRCAPEVQAAFNERRPARACRAPSGPPAAARAGTSTPRAATPRSGPASHGRTGSGRSTSTLRTMR